jgi:hypothetical protein
LVPYVRQKETLRKWLDYCFKFVIDDYKKTGKMKKVHLLGITTEWILQRYPCFSSDSSSWVACLRFGHGGATKIAKIPKYTQSDSAKKTTTYVLGAEITKYQNMEKDATSLWKKRGVTFDED